MIFVFVLQNALELTYGNAELKNLAEKTTKGRERRKRGEGAGERKGDGEGEGGRRGRRRWNGVGVWS